MKLLVGIEFIVFIIFSGGLFAQNTNENYSAQLRIIRIGWSSKEWQNPERDTTYIEVNRGENFGARNAPHYFTLLNIIDRDSIQIKFTDDLVVVGEPVSMPSKKNPIVIKSGEKTCFRTRLYDGGTDYCIDFWYP